MIGGNSLLVYVNPLNPAGTMYTASVDECAGVMPPPPPPASMPWDSITGKPTLFSGSYLDLTNKPTLFDGAYASLTGKPTLGTAAAAAVGDFATAAQGTLAGTAVQPAGLTKAAVGLGNCDNTSDANKPVSSATQTALNAKLDSNAAAVTNGRRPVFAAGDGATVTQQTNKSTGVTINKLCGQITMNGAALAAAAEVSFVVTNSTVAATDVPVVAIQSVGTVGSYFAQVAAVANGSFTITVGNTSAGSLSQALVLNFAVTKAVNA